MQWINRIITALAITTSFVSTARAHVNNAPSVKIVLRNFNAVSLVDDPISHVLVAGGNFTTSLNTNADLSEGIALLDDRTDRVIGTLNLVSLGGNSRPTWIFAFDRARHRVYAALNSDSLGLDSTTLYGIDLRNGKVVTRLRTGSGEISSVGVDPKSGTVALTVFSAPNNTLAIVSAYNHIIKVQPIVVGSDVVCVDPRSGWVVIRSYDATTISAFNGKSLRVQWSQQLQYLPFNGNIQCDPVSGQVEWLAPRDGGVATGIVALSIAKGTFTTRTPFAYTPSLSTSAPLQYHLLLDPKFGTAIAYGDLDMVFIKEKGQLSLNWVYHGESSAGWIDTTAHRAYLVDSPTHSAFGSTGTPTWYIDVLDTRTGLVLNRYANPLGSNSTGFSFIDARGGYVPAAETNQNTGAQAPLLELFAFR